MTSRFTDLLVTVFTAGFFAGSTLAFLAHYAALDDSDILCALKSWQYVADEELAQWARMFLTRRLLKVHVDPENADGYLFTKKVEKEGESHLYAFYNQNT